MWKILGKEVIYIDIPETWKSRMLEMAGDDEKSQKFKEIVSASEVTHLMNGTTEEHTFFIRLDKEITPEEIQILADVALDILKTSESPCIEVEGTFPKYQVVITNWEEPEIIGLRKTPGMSSGAVFKPIIQGLDAPGRPNKALESRYLRSLLSKHESKSRLGVPGGTFLFSSPSRPPERSTVRNSLRLASISDTVGFSIDT
jgi:hypothetical protein